MIKDLLKNAEKNLNDFKLSTNASDIIFDTNTRNFKLEQLRNRVNEIEFKELELREFYKKNHPIYVTLTQQKNLILGHIKQIEDELPNVPSTQRNLENFKREVNIYSEVLKDLLTKQSDVASRLYGDVYGDTLSSQSLQNDPKPIQAEYSSFK